MADVNITVALQGINQALSGFARLRNSASSLARVQGTLAAALGGFTVGAGIKSVIDLADSYTLLSSRLTIVSKSAADNAAKMETIFQIAQDARVPLEAVGRTYQRVSLNTERLGITQAEVAVITSTLSKSFLLSGSTAEEAAGGMTQLTQALAKGKLDGDELRSVFENMPIVVKAMEEATGKTRGELYKLASQGKLTADLLVKVLLKAASNVNDEFSKMPRTVGQAATQLTNAFERAIGLGNAGQAAVGEFGKAIDALRVAISSPAFSAGMARFIAFIGTGAKYAAMFISSFAPAEATFAGTQNKLDGLNAELATLQEEQKNLLAAKGWFIWKTQTQQLVENEQAQERVTAAIRATTAALDQLAQAQKSQGHPDPTALAAVAARIRLNATIQDTTKYTKEELAQLGLDKAGWAEHTQVIYDAAYTYDLIRQHASDAASDVIDGFLQARTPLQEFRDQIAEISRRMLELGYDAPLVSKLTLDAAGQLASAWTGVGTAIEGVRQMTQQALSEFASAVADMVVEGQKNWQDFFKSLEKMMIQFLVSQAVQGVLKLLLTLAFGPAGGIGGGLLGSLFSGGGAVAANAAAIGNISNWTDVGGGLMVGPAFLGKGGAVPKYMASGGPSGTDTVPAWLTPGEFVVNRKAATKHRALLEAINGGPGYASGGMASGGGGSSIIINNSGLTVYDDVSITRVARKLAEADDYSKRRRFGREQRGDSLRGKSR